MTDFVDSLDQREERVGKIVGRMPGLLTFFIGVATLWWSLPSWEEIILWLASEEDLWWLDLMILTGLTNAILATLLAHVALEYLTRCVVALTIFRSPPEQ